MEVNLSSRLAQTSMEVHYYPPTSTKAVSMEVNIIQLTQTSAEVQHHPPTSMKAVSMEVHTFQLFALPWK